MCFEANGTVTRNFGYVPETDLEEFVDDLDTSDTIPATDDSTETTESRVVAVAPKPQAQVRAEPPRGPQSSYPCTMCDKVLPSEQSFAVHMSVHSAQQKLEQEKMMCAVCGKSGMNKRAFDNHMILHSRERPFQCPHCPKTFARKGGVIAHIRTHTGDKPYKCDYCGALFATWSSHSIHVRRHTGEKPHSCHHCGERFIARTALNVGTSGGKCPREPSNSFLSPFRSISSLMGASTCSGAASATGDSRRSKRYRSTLRISIT